MKGTVGAEASVQQNCTKRNIYEVYWGIEINGKSRWPNYWHWLVFYRLWTNLASRNICGHQKYKLQLSFNYKAVKFS